MSEMKIQRSAWLREYERRRLAYAEALVTGSGSEDAKRALDEWVEGTAPGDGEAVLQRIRHGLNLIGLDAIGRGDTDNLRRWLIDQGFTWEDGETHGATVQRVTQAVSSLLTTALPSAPSFDVVMTLSGDILPATSTALRRIVDAAQRAHSARSGVEEGGDTERIAFLESLVHNKSYWRDIVLCWDHEDGFWLGKVERGSHNALALDGAESHQSLRAAIDAVRLSPARES